MPFPLLYYFGRIIEIADTCFSTVICYIVGRCSGVKISKGCSFSGRTKFRTLSLGKVRIGSGCRFLSRSTSNLLGLNHCCIIAQLSPNAEISIGKNCGFSGASICAETGITIGDNVRIGANSTVTDTDWHSDDNRVGHPKPVTIHDHAWIGTSVIILKGVEIGENSLIGAGSVVTKSIPANCIAAGNPAQVIRYFK